MSLSTKFSPQLGARAALLSVRPRFANLIVEGLKRVEFRRVWARQPVQWIAVYCTSPVRRIVAVVEVESALAASPTALLALNSDRGGGLTRAELRAYFAGRRMGHALLLGRKFLPSEPLDPATVISGFQAPQSFRYLTDGEAARISKKVRS